MIPAADLLRTILTDADVIGETPDGRTWLLIAAPQPWLDDLAELGAGIEDDEPNGDDEEEPLEDDDDGEPEVT